MLKNKYKEALETEYTKISFRTDNRRTNDPQLISTYISTTTQQINLKNIDFLSVLKASHHISGSIDIDSLSKKLLKIVLENAGAQKGCLFFLKENSLTIKSIYCIDEHGPMLLKDTQDDKSIYPESVINYVSRTRKNVVVGDAVKHDSVHGKDPYIQSRQVRSVLCMPLIRNDAIIAILYLENRDAANVFNEDRIKVLEFLSADVGSINKDLASLRSYCKI